MKQNKTSAESKENINQARKHGCHANEEVSLLLDNLAGFVFGSCVNAVEVASILVPESWQNKKSNRRERKKHKRLDPRIARFAGNFQSKSLNPQESVEGIPNHLEGQALGYSVEERTIFDDNISALSAFTLEEMARVNGHPAVSRFGDKHPAALYNHPPPLRD